MNYACIIIGTSAGGIDALSDVLKELPKPFPVPIIIVQHLSARFESYLPIIIEKKTGIPTKEVDDKDRLQANKIYIAPPNYHLLLEKNGVLSLTTCERVSYARPSIDVAFETAADAFRERLIGILLTGANKDGARGLERIHQLGGITMVQDPKTAYAKEMPNAALNLIKPNYILSCKDINKEIINIIFDKGDTPWQKKK